MNAATLCSNCSQPLKPEASVRLWDGRDYCHPCVEQVCPQLLGYALAHDVLEEAMPYNRSRVIWRSLLWIGVVCAAFWGMVALVPHEEETPDWLGFALVAVVISAILVAMYVPALLWGTKRAISKVMVSEGRLTVCRPKMRGLRQVTFALNECRWYVGRVRHDTFLRDSPIPNEQAIILVYTVPVPGFRYRIRTACGFSEETRQIWEGFLRLARIAEARKWGDAPFLHRLGDLIP